MILHILLLLFLDTLKGQFISDNSNGVLESLEGDNFFDEITKEYLYADNAAYYQDERRIVGNQPQRLIYEEMVNVLSTYFYKTYQVMERIPCEPLGRLTEKAFYDSIGSYLKSHLMPVINHAFYAGHVCLSTVSKLQSIYEKCTFYGRTNGRTWPRPKTELLETLCYIKVKPLESRTPCEGCEALDLDGCKQRDGSFLVSMPELEPEDEMSLLTNIRLPLRDKNIYCLRSNSTAFIMVKFFETVTQCYTSKHMCQDAFNDQLKSWISLNVLPHLTDTQFYPGFGGILRVYETLQKSGNVLEVDSICGGCAKANFELSHLTGETDKNDEDDPVSYDDVHESDISFNQECSNKSIFKRFVDECKKNKHSVYSGCTVMCMIILLLLFYYFYLRKNMHKFSRKRCDPDDIKNYLRRLVGCEKKKTQDEEILIHPEGKSILSTKSKKSVKDYPSTSSSSLGFKPKFKLIPSAKKHSRKAGGGLSSSSEGTDDSDKDNFHKYFSKTQTLNEKPSTSKKAKAKQNKIHISNQSSSSSRENSPTKQTSWSTIFSS